MNPNTRTLAIAALSGVSFTAHTVAAEKKMYSEGEGTRASAPKRLCTPE